MSINNPEDLQNIVVKVAEVHFPLQLPMNKIDIREHQNEIEKIIMTELERTKIKVRHLVDEYFRIQYKEDGHYDADKDITNCVFIIPPISFEVEIPHDVEEGIHNDAIDKIINEEVKIHIDKSKERILSYYEEYYSLGNGNVNVSFNDLLENLGVSNG